LDAVAGITGKADCHPVYGFDWFSTCVRLWIRHAVVPPRLLLPHPLGHIRGKLTSVKAFSGPRKQMGNLVKSVTLEQGKQAGSTPLRLRVSVRNDFPHAVTRSRALCCHPPSGDSLLQSSEASPEDGRRHLPFVTPEGRNVCPVDAPQASRFTKGRLRNAGLPPAWE
jgi:hypothetical protein